MKKVTEATVQIRLQQLSSEIKLCSVIHPRVERGLELMGMGVESAVNEGNRSGVMITGESRSGKTKLLKIFEDRASQYGCDPNSILFVSLSGPTDVLGLATAILEAAGDPMPDIGDLKARKARLWRILRDRKYMMVQIDEAQQVIDHRSDDVVHDIGDFFKGFMNERNSEEPKLPTCFVLSGTPRLQRLLELNSQLTNRFFSPLELQLFSAANELDLKDLRMLMIALEKQITIASMARLGTTEMAMRFRAASDGCIGIVVDLIQHAGCSAIRDYRQSITVGDLAEAYDLLISAGKLSLGNPFRAGLSKVTEAAFAAPTMNADRRGTGRRSPGKRREVKLKEVLNVGRSA